MWKSKVLAKCFDTTSVETLSVVHLKLNKCDIITFMDIKTNGWGCCEIKFVTIGALQNRQP